MPPPKSAGSTRGSIYLHTPLPLYAARHGARRSCLALAASNAGAEDQALRCSALLCLLCLLALSRRSQHLPPTRPTVHPAHAPDTHFATATATATAACPPSPVDPPTRPSAIAASLRQHLRLCVPSPCIQSSPNHACRAEGGRCICHHRARRCCRTPSVSRRW